MKKKFLLSGFFLLMFCVLAVLLKTVNVAPVGPLGSSIGLSRANRAFFDLFGTSDAWDKATDLGLGVCILMAVLLIGYGAYQLVRRKKLVKVDKEFFALAGLYAVMAVAFVAFEKIITINCRPVLEADGTLEASFPSTHTLVSCVVAGSAALLAGKYIKNEKLRVAFRIVCAVLMIVTPVGRILAGKHWFTDVFGGYLLSAGLVAAFWGILDCLKPVKKKA